MSRFYTAIALSILLLIGIGVGVSKWHDKTLASQQQVWEQQANAHRAKAENATGAASVLQAQLAKQMVVIASQSKEISRIKAASIPLTFASVTNIPPDCVEKIKEVERICVSTVASRDEVIVAQDKQIQSYSSAVSIATTESAALRLSNTELMVADDSRKQELDIMTKQISLETKRKVWWRSGAIGVGVALVTTILIRK